MKKVVASVFRFFAPKKLTPQDLADQADRILSGKCRKWDVDSYENTNPKDERLDDLLRRTLAIGGLPEEWVKLDDEQKKAISGLIEEMRRMKSRES
ncbi:MAG: hypothetical protein WAL56_03060 [Candidatus Sulfotelmatobacter sp.]